MVGGVCHEGRKGRGWWVRVVCGFLWFPAHFNPLEPLDRLLEVNEVDVSTMNHNELGDLLQKSSSSVIRLVVGRLVPMEMLTPPRATSPTDPKRSSLQHKVSPPKTLDGVEVAELKDKCRR